MRTLVLSARMLAPSPVSEGAHAHAAPLVRPRSASMRCGAGNADDDDPEERYIASLACAEGCAAGAAGAEGAASATGATG